MLLVNLRLSATVFCTHPELRVGKREFTHPQLVESGVSKIAKTHLKMLVVSHISKWSSSQGQPCSSANKITGYGHLDSDLGFKERTLSKQQQYFLALTQIQNAKRAFAAIIGRMDD